MDKNFFLKPATVLAPELLGKILCVKQSDGYVLKSRITETECYYGTEDSASHAFKGKRTARTEVMFDEGGTIYVYLCYGMHNMLNIVSGKKEHPEAVLIRAVESAKGPGNVCKYFGITKAYNAQKIIGNINIWLEDDGVVPTINTAKRVGIGYAKKEDQEKLWRFFML